MNENSPIELFDTTLRDGTQGEGISLSVDDKIHIAKHLDDFGIDFIGILFAFLFYLVIRRFRLSKWSRYFYF